MTAQQLLIVTAAIALIAIALLCWHDIVQQRRIDLWRRRATTAASKHRNAASAARVWQDKAYELDDRLEKMTAAMVEHRRDALVARRIAAHDRRGFLEHTAQHATTKALDGIIYGHDGMPAIDVSTSDTHQMQQTMRRALTRGAA